MNLVDLFPAERVFLNVDVSSKRELLGFFAKRAEEMGLVQGQRCAQALSAREELGSTGLGNGIAIPHARIKDLDQPIGLFATLARPIDYEAVDQEPVDVAIMLLMPEKSASDQMKVLSRVARIARQEPIMSALRRAETVEEAVELLSRADAGV